MLDSSSCIIPAQLEVVISMRLTQIEREAAKLAIKPGSTPDCRPPSTCDLQAVEKAWIAEIEDRELALASGHMSVVPASKAIDAALIMIHRQRG